MKLKTISAVSLLMATVFPASAATVDLTGLGYVQYGDAQSYSMPIANYQYGYNTNTGPFAISSTPGQISSLTVLGTGSSGQPVVNNYSGMDNAYATPSGEKGETFFYANSTTYQGTTGSVAFNGTNTWDTSLSALKSFLGEDQLAVFFNNNQINSGGTSLQSLAAWGRIWITDSAGNVINGSTFEFTNNNKPYALVTEGGGGTFGGLVGSYTATGDGPGGPDAATALNSDFVLSGGSICVATGGALTVPVPVKCGSDPAEVGGTTISAAIDHNLGADHVAYTLLFPELNALLAQLFDNIANLDDYTMHVDMRLGCAVKATTVDSKGDPVYSDDPYGVSFQACDPINDWGTGLNNGFEQIFLGTAVVGSCPRTDPNCNPTLPEPGSLALFAAGLALLGWRSCKQKK